MRKTKEPIVSKFTLRLNKGESDNLKKVKGILSVPTQRKAITTALNELPYYMDQFKKLSEENKNLYHENTNLKSELLQITGG